uniref:Anti_prolifrtn domain-containing protein n=1 Tax=Macrostomum lignano TaxID=282301 RepID=A0A1I8IYY5_9PLAT
YFSKAKAAWRHQQHLLHRIPEADSEDAQRGVSSGGFHCIPAVPPPATPPMVVHLCEQLRQDMLTHQFSLSEMSGLQIEGPRDPLLMRAAQQAGLQPMEVARQLPQDLALWIQPGRVAVRIDKNDHATLLNSDSDTADNLPQARWRAATGSTSSYFTAEEFAANQRLMEYSFTSDTSEAAGAPTEVGTAAQPDIRNTGTPGASQIIPEWLDNRTADLRFLKKKARSIARYKAFLQRKAEERRNAKAAPPATSEEGAGNSANPRRSRHPTRGRTPRAGLMRQVPPKLLVRLAPPVTGPLPVWKLPRPWRDPKRGRWPKPQSRSATYAAMAKRQPALVIQGQETPLTAEQLDLIWRRLDSHLVKMALSGTAIRSPKDESRGPSPPYPARRQPVRTAAPRAAENLRLGYGAFIYREDERPRTHRHRAWIPARSCITKADELRHLLVASNPELPANGVVVHETISKPGGDGFTAILGLSDSWMLRYPDMSIISVGLMQIQLFSFESDATAHRPPEKRKRATWTLSEGKPAKAAATGGRGKGRKPARNTIRSGLTQRLAATTSCHHCCPPPPENRVESENAAQVAAPPLTMETTREEPMELEPGAIGEAEEAALLHNSP